MHCKFSKLLNAHKSHVRPLGRPPYPLAPYQIVGRGGASVESMPFDRRVVVSNTALDATYGPSLTVACSTTASKLRCSVNCSCRELFWKAQAVRGAIEMDKYNIKNQASNRQGSRFVSVLGQRPGWSSWWASVDTWDTWLQSVMIADVRWRRNRIVTG